jgi:hypothetical protein
MNICAQLRDYSGFPALPLKKMSQHILLGSGKRLTGLSGTPMAGVQKPALALGNPAFATPSLQAHKRIIILPPLLLSRGGVLRLLKSIRPKNTLAHLAATTCVGVADCGVCRLSISKG